MEPSIRSNKREGGAVLAPPPLQRQRGGQPVAATEARLQWPALGTIPPTQSWRTKNGTVVAYHFPVLDLPSPTLSDRRLKVLAHHATGLDCRNGFLELKFRMTVEEFGARLRKVRGVDRMGFLPKKAATVFDKHEQACNFQVWSKKFSKPFEFELTRNGHKQESPQAVCTAQFLNVDHWQPAMLGEGYRILTDAVFDKARFPELFVEMREQHLRWWSERLLIAEVRQELLPKGKHVDSALAEEEEEQEARPASGSPASTQASASCPAAAGAGAAAPSAAAATPSAAQPPPAREPQPPEPAGSSKAPGHRKCPPHYHMKRFLKIHGNGNVMP